MKVLLLLLRIFNKKGLLIRSFSILVISCFILLIAEDFFFHQPHFKAPHPLSTALLIGNTPDNHSIGADYSFHDDDGYTAYTVKRLRIKVLEHQTALEPKFGSVVNDVMSFQYPIDILNNSCAHSSSNLRLLIVVVSAVGHTKRRQFIRRHFADESHHRRKLIFLVGSVIRNGDHFVAEKLKNESLQHADIVQVGVIDSYGNLTLKSVALLHWVYTHCPKADYILKIDDDVFVNNKALEEQLDQFNRSKGHLYGTKVEHDKPQRAKGIYRMRK